MQKTGLAKEQCANRDPGVVIKYWKKNTGLVGANRNPGVVIKYWKKNTGLVGANRNPGVVIKC